MCDEEQPELVPHIGAVRYGNQLRGTGTPPSTNEALLGTSVYTDIFNELPPEETDRLPSLPR